MGSTRRAWSTVGSEMGCTQSQDDDRNIVVSDEDSSTHSQGDKPIRRISDSSDSPAVRSSRKKNKKGTSLFGRFSSLRSAAPVSVTARELEAWSDPTTGFESLMSSPAGRQIFQKFLAGEFSAENLIFWTACNDLKSVKKKEIFKERVEKIFLNHLDTSSQYEVSLDAKVKEKLMNERENPGENIFDEAQSKIYSLMHRDSFARFLVSDYYMKLKWEKGRPKTIDLIVTDGETTESVFSQSGDQSETSQPGDQSETGGITETTTKEPPAQEVEMTEAGPESSVLRPVSVQTQKVIDEFQTNTLDYETEKLLIFSKNEIMKIKE